MSRPPRPIDLTATLEKANVPCFVTDRGGTLTWLNDAARAAFGDLTGRPIADVVAPEDVAVVEQARRVKLAGDVPATDYSVRVITSDGRRRTAEVSSVRIPGGDDFHAVFGIARPGRIAAAAAVHLTARQDEILQLLAAGASTDAIAARLHLSKETVRNHVRNILRALDAHSRLEAVALAHERGLIP